jgi:hypothetical protein
LIPVVENSGARSIRSGADAHLLSQRRLGLMRGECPARTLRAPFERPSSQSGNRDCIAIARKTQ